MSFNLKWDGDDDPLTGSPTMTDAGERAMLSEAQIKYMAERFLGWKLPEHFCPDAGISFDPVFSKGTPYEGRHQPTGTNLFDYTQAVAMVRHMAEGLPE